MLACSSSPGHVGGADVEALVGDDVLGVVDAREGRVRGVGAVRRVPTRNLEQLPRVVIIITVIIIVVVNTVNLVVVITPSSSSPSSASPPQPT
jgi:hypothetical protein